jgi:hypothetical protein
VAAAHQADRDHGDFARDNLSNPGRQVHQIEQEGLDNEWPPL